MGVNDIEPFSRDKLLVSVYDSLRHRKTALSDASGLTNTIIGRLLHMVENAQLSKNDIARTAIAVLKRFDAVAATHYGAFHPLEP